MRLQEAMIEEAAYVKDKLNGINTNLIERIAKYGYYDLDKYFRDKKEYLFKNWTPEIYYINEDFLDIQMELSIINKQYGIYIISPQSKYYAFHGNDEIDFEECENLGVRVIEMHYRGGTIIGSANDFGIMFVVPNEILLDGGTITSKMLQIMQKYIPNAIVVGNDILIDGKKVAGSMQRYVNGVFIWAAQFSFENHDNLIELICKKKSTKSPGVIDENLLSRDIFEKEVLLWVC